MTGSHETDSDQAPAADSSSSPTHRADSADGTTGNDEQPYHDYNQGVFDQGQPEDEAAADHNQTAFDQDKREDPAHPGQGVFDQGEEEQADAPGQGAFDQGHRHRPHS